MGTIINALLIIVGSGAGLFIGSKLNEKIKTTIIAGIGLFTLALGVKMFLDAGNAIVVLLGLIIGGLVGEWLKVEVLIENLGIKIESKVNSKNSGQSTFIQGFMTSSILFISGPMAILGAIQDGLTGTFEILLIKSIMDGFTALALSSSLGVGVLFSSVVVLAYQGILTLLATQVSAVISDPMLNDLSGVGGILLIGLAISSLLEIKKIRVGNFIPSLFITPLITALFVLLNLY
jgi:uncharacterized membrane protein YqgA involved in biofilm formation